MFLIKLELIKCEQCCMAVNYGYDKIYWGTFPISADKITTNKEVD